MVSQSFLGRICHNFPAFHGEFNRKSPRLQANRCWFAANLRCLTFNYDDNCGLGHDLRFPGHFSEGKLCLGWVFSNGRYWTFTRSGWDCPAQQLDQRFVGKFVGFWAWKELIGEDRRKTTLHRFSRGIEKALIPFLQDQAASTPQILWVHDSKCRRHRAAYKTWFFFQDPGFRRMIFEKSSERGHILCTFFGFPEPRQPNFGWCWRIALGVEQGHGFISHHLQSFAPPMTSQELKLPMNTRCSFVFEFKVNSTEMDQLLRRFCVTWSWNLDGRLRLVERLM